MNNYYSSCLSNDTKNYEGKSFLILFENGDKQDEKFQNRSMIYNFYGHLHFITITFI